MAWNWWRTHNLAALTAHSQDPRIIVENFNKESLMATMNFSIPDEVKERFNRAFADRNKSAIVTQLLEDAIAQAERQQRSNVAIDRILSRLHHQRTPVDDEDAIRAVREDGRP